MSASVSVLSNANHSAFQLDTDTEETLGTGYTWESNNVVTGYAATRDTGTVPGQVPLQSTWESHVPHIPTGTGRPDGV